MKFTRQTERLSLLHNVALDEPASAAHHRLLCDVLGPVPVQAQAAGGPWTTFAFFEPRGRCVAALDAGVLPLILDGERHVAGTIRSAATDPDWRGLGLFRRLMRKALEYCEAQGAAITLLYTETPALYEAFGFRPIPQHKFVGRTARSAARLSARTLNLNDAKDRDLVRNLVDRRVPVSSRCALLVDAPLFLANVAKDSALWLLHDAERDVMIVFEQDSDALVIADVVATQVPTFETLMGLLPAAERLTCLFAPDALGWHGVPQVEDTGLMIRGPIPPAMAQPFMFPPTCEF